jgi:hypothetical protein
VHLLYITHKKIYWGLARHGEFQDDFKKLGAITQSGLDTNRLTNAVDVHAGNPRKRIDRGDG